MEAELELGGPRGLRCGRGRPDLPHSAEIDHPTSANLGEAGRLEGIDELTELTNAGLAWRSTTIRIELARPTRHRNSSDELPR